LLAFPLPGRARGGLHHLPDDPGQGGGREGGAPGRRHPALAVTGGVITSAGFVLAATFSVLAVLPLVEMLQMGIVVALGYYSTRW